MTSPDARQGEPGRFHALRCAILAALLLGLLASWKLWLLPRSFPVLPLVPGFPQLNRPWDFTLLGLMLGACVASLRAYRPAIGFLLACMVVLYCGDQNRGQPWFYLYAILLLLTLLPEAPALAAARLVITAVYFWAGVQKFGPDYREAIIPYMMQPVANWLPPGGAVAVKWGLLGAPVVEVLMAIGLWMPRLRRAAIVIILVVHAVALLILGPLGHNQNLVVWPWNLAMVAFVLILFPAVRLAGAWRDLRRSVAAVVITALVSLLPVLSYFGCWDSYFSFALYSGNTAKSDLFLVPALAQKLPEDLRRYAHPLNESVVAANPGLKGLWVFDTQSWALDSLLVPPIPEPRNFRSMAAAIAAYAEQPTDVQLMVFPRRGEPQVWRADQLR